MPSLMRYPRTFVSYRRCPRVPRGADLVCVLMSCLSLEAWQVAFGAHVVLLSRRILHIVVTLRAHKTTVCQMRKRKRHSCTNAESPENASRSKNIFSPRKQIAQISIGIHGKKGI
ncbi:hypothetical protein LZ31DRAFT_380680 [Colletotrichum somersetense]|nr:hypothetical protein LZ31DRAFT_380680 [Colletotrichum somersetense]